MSCLTTLYFLLPSLLLANYFLFYDNTYRIYVLTYRYILFILFRRMDRRKLTPAHSTDIICTELISQLINYTVKLIFRSVLELSDQIRSLINVLPLARLWHLLYLLVSWFVKAVTIIIIDGWDCDVRNFGWRWLLLEENTPELPIHVCNNWTSEVN